MEVNDIEPETDKTDSFQGTVSADIHEIVIREEDDDDVHLCRKCNLVFCNIQKYLEHKVKHDNFKVKYCKSEIDRRMIMPTLVQKQTRSKTIKTESDRTEEEEKENDQQGKKGKRGRRKLDEVHSQDLVITEKPVYICSKCDRKFNREASLKRHQEYDHKEGSDDDIGDDEDDYQEVDDEDQEYKPNLAVVKEELEEDEEAEREMQEEAPPEIDSLDQVIMAAALVERAEAQGQGQGQGQIQVCIQDSTGQLGKGEMVAIATRVNGTEIRLAPKSDIRTQTQPTKRQKLGDDDKAGRRFVCTICGNKFKELAVLKAHMLTHSNKRQFMCSYEGCSYAFKTKGSLKRHMRRHTGERPYPCELCGRTFTESGALTRHLKSRTPCTTKSDEDLPRYRKKWASGVTVPASLAGVVGRQITESQAQQQINADNFESVINIQELEQEGEVADEQLTDIQEVRDVLDESVQDDDEQLFDGTASDGVEVVIADGVEAIIEDETIQEFVHTETVSQSTSTVCRVCHEEFLSLEALKIHLRTHLAEDTCKCQLCHFITDSKEDFENHMFLQHNVQIRSSDPLTDIVPTRPEKNGANKDGNNVIGEANIALKQLLELPQEDGEPEAETEIAGTLFKCPVCNKQFRGSAYLKLHMRNHTGLRPHKCFKCQRSFITRDTLKKHMSTHIEDRNFKCGECGKLFKRLSHVREHIKIHSGIRPFSCTFCDKSFKTNNAMKVHLRTHTDILPYECTFCHRRFREKGSVIRHTRMHTGEKPYECQHCGRRFAEHGTLNRHLKAKVSCKKQMVMMKGYEDDEDMDYTVLTEFSSVVADTQQYIVPGQAEEGDSKEGEVTQTDEDSQQPTEIIIQTNEEEEQVQNVEIDNMEVVPHNEGEVVTQDEGETSVVEAVQVTDDYLVITDDESGLMQVLDRTTGETVAIVPMENMEVVDSQGQTVTMSEVDVSTVTMVPDSQVDGEMVTITQFIEGGQVLTQTVESEDGTTQVIEAVDQSGEDQVETTVIGEVGGSVEDANQNDLSDSDSLQTQMS